MRDIWLTTLSTLNVGAGNRKTSVWERMSIINENRARNRSKPISWPSWARVGLGFLPLRGCCCCSDCGC